MTDYLTNLVARSLEPTPAIRPRLASLFEPLREIGPMFPRPATLADGLESSGVSEEGAPDALVQARAANGLENEARKSSAPITALKVIDESSHPVEIEEVSPRVRKQERGPVATAMKPATAESPKREKIADGISPGSQTVPAEPSPQKVNTQTVIPVVRLLSADEDPHRNDPSAGETDQAAPRDENAPSAAADSRAPQRQVSATRLQNRSSERRASEALKPRVENDSITIAPADNSDQRERSGTLIVPRILIENIGADKYQRRPIFLPVSSVPQGGSGFSSSTNALDSATGSAARPVAESDKEPAQTETTETIAPIINVTIGRVEVRAAPATSQLKDRNSTVSSKLMSLDDYLRQRAQGGKR